MSTHSLRDYRTCNSQIVNPCLAPTQSHTDVHHQAKLTNFIHTPPSFRGTISNLFDSSHIENGIPTVCLHLNSYSMEYTYIPAFDQFTICRRTVSDPCPLESPTADARSGHFRNRTKVAFIWISFFICSTTLSSIPFPVSKWWRWLWLWLLCLCCCCDLIEKGRPGERGQKGDASSPGIDVLSAVKVIKFSASNDNW